MSEQLIPTLNSAAHVWLSWMWPMVWQSTVLVLGLVALTWLLRGRSARLRYALWLLVPIRLVLPPTLALATGWAWWVLPADTPVEVAAVIEVETHKIELLVDPLPEQQTHVASRPAPFHSGIPSVTKPPSSEVNSQPSVIPPIEPEILKSSSSGVTMTWQSGLFLGWVIGIALFAARLAFGLTQAASMTRRSVVPSRTEVVDLLETCRSRMGLRQTVRLRQLDDAGVPMLIGILRPTIILPQGVEHTLTSRELEAVFVHELHHVARRDALVHLIQTVLGILYFFHPLVWVTNRVLGRLREDACDEATVAVLEGNRRDYGTGIVKIAEMAVEQPPSVALGIVRPGAQVKRRLERILDPRLSLGRRLSWSALALLLVVGAVLLPTAPRPGDPTPPTTVATSSESELDESSSDSKVDVQPADDESKDISSPNRQKPPKDEFKLHGFVVDANGETAVGVKVFLEWMIYPPGRVETLTDAHGRYVLIVPRKKMGGRLVWAMADSGQQQAQYQVPWKEDGSERETRLQLQPARQVELHVVDGAGKAIANAKAGVSGNFNVLGTGTTDDDGHVVFLVPHDIRVEYVFALSDGNGADYRAYVLPRGRNGDQNVKTPELPDGPIRLTLDRTQPLNAQVVESDDSPIAGVKLYLSALKKPNQPGLPVGYFAELIESKTDKSGKAAFNWFPHWHDSRITVWPISDEYSMERGMYDPKTGGVMKITLDKLVPISGRVTLPDGLPAAGIEVTAVGNGYQYDGFRGTVTTDDDGRYVIRAAPNMVYLVLARGKKLATAPQTGFTLWPGKPIENLDFALRPATRLHGQVTFGLNHEPVEGQRISVSQHVASFHKMKNERGVIILPRPEQKNSVGGLSILHNMSSDANGYFEVYVGEGNFSIGGPTQNEVREFEITDETEKQFNFHADYSEKSILRGLVVSGNPPQTVVDAEITGIYRKGFGRNIKAVTDKSGRFEVERKSHRTEIHARSKDGKLAGVIEIGPGEKVVTIPIRPLGSITGRLIDAVTRRPLGDQEIVLGVRTRGSSTLYQAIPPALGGIAITDRNGRFELDGMTVGRDYVMQVTVDRNVELVKRSMYLVGDAYVKDASQLDIGDLEYSPSRPPRSTEQRIRDSFKKDGTPVERFEKAKTDAAISRQRVLVLFGDPKGDAVQQLMSLRYDDGEVRRAFDPFQLIAVDSSADKLAGAKTLARSIGEKLDGARAEFSLFVTDSDGVVLGRAEPSLLLADKESNRNNLLSFLRLHTSEPLDAQQLLDKALGRAKKEGKRVIVQETVTWCGPCWVLSRFFEKEHAKWDRDYILVSPKPTAFGRATLIGSADPA